MPTANEVYTIERDGWTVRVRQPEDPTSPRSMLLLHGWTGDENVMWIFTRKLPGNYWLFAPRGPIPTGGGYAWLPHEGGLNSLKEFSEPAQALMGAFTTWAEAEGAPHQPVDVMGFSQGAAMAYTLAALYPQRIDRIMALAGFLPRADAVSQLPGVQGYQSLRGKQIYIAHGTRDQIIPVHKAEEAVQALRSTDAQVTYCESETGHKLSADCLRGLEAFLK